MKKIVSSLVMGLMLVGCAYDKATLEYAQKNNLSEDLYKKVEIACVAKPKDKLNMKSLVSKISSQIKEEVKPKYEQYYMHKCKNYLLSGAIGSISSERAFGLYLSCKMNYDENIIVNHRETKDKNKQFINFSYFIKNIGNFNADYIGLEEIDNKFIYFYRGNNDIGRIIKNECKNNIFEIK